jgi:predicted transposase YdaD
MRYRHEKVAETLIKQLCHKEEGIMHAERAARKADRDFLRYMKRTGEILASMDHAQLIYETEQKGEQKKSKEIARNALAKGYPVEEISEITGLDIDTIKNLE